MDDLASPGGRILLDAFVMLLGVQRFFGVREDHQLPQLLRASRLRQSDVTNQLAKQVFEALEHLLKAFESASERQRRVLFDDSPESDEEVYSGLLTVLLRLVFVIYAEDRDLLPVSNAHYQQHRRTLSTAAESEQEPGTLCRC